MDKKKVTTLHLDEDVLYKAKKEITNISSFIENCLRAYLGLDHCEFNISSIENELNIMKQANLNIHLLSSKSEIENTKAQFSEKEIDSAWSDLWRNYRNNNIISQQYLNRFSEKSGLDSEYIVTMIETLDLYCDRKQLLKCETFRGAEKQYTIFRNE